MLLTGSISKGWVSRGSGTGSFIGVQRMQILDQVFHELCLVPASTALTPTLSNDRGLNEAKGYDEFNQRRYQAGGSCLTPQATELSRAVVGHLSQSRHPGKITPVYWQVLQRSSWMRLSPQQGGQAGGWCDYAPEWLWAGCLKRSGGLEKLLEMCSQPWHVS